MLYFIYSSAPSMPVNLMAIINNSTSVTLTWNEPEVPNGNIQDYTISIFDDNMNSVQNLTVISNLLLVAVITNLTPNTSYVVNINAVTVRPGETASTTFTTPACT